MSGVRTAGVVRALTGVYHADGGVRGEVAYALGKLRGTTHCTLCDLTHRGVRRRADWSAMAAALPVPMAVVHRDERTPEVAAVTDGATPAVVAHTDDGLVVVLGPDEVGAVDADVGRFRAALEAAVRARGLRWP